MKFQCPCGREFEITEIKKLVKNTTSKQPEKSTIKKTKVVNAIISNKTDKALMLLIDGVEGWVPKSTIHSEYDEESLKIQEFIIDGWIIKNKFGG